MHATLRDHVPAIAIACRRHAVQSLELFGSATGPAYEPDRSDVDMIVNFGPAAQSELFSHYFGLKEDLEALLGRPVDLVMAGALRDPHVLRSAALQRQLLYAFPQPEVA